MDAKDARQEDPSHRELDPVEFLRRALAISPEDAAQVREDAAKREHRDNDESRDQHGPAADHGDG